MRILTHHSNQKVGSVFIGWLGCRFSFREWGDNERLVPPAIIPGSGVSDFTVTLLPLLRFGSSAHQRKRRTRQNRNVGASNNFEQAQGMRHLFITPLIAADHSDPKHLDLR